MVVFVATSYDWSDSTVIGVFSVRELAECAILPFKAKGPYRYSYSIKECELDKVYLETPDERS